MTVFQTLEPFLEFVGGLGEIARLVGPVPS